MNLYTSIYHDVQEQSKWPHHKYIHEAQRVKPGGDAYLLAVAIDPAPCPEIKGEEVNPRSGQA